MNLSDRFQTILTYLIPVLIAAVLKIWVIFSAKVPFNADEAIVALMARHINQGQIPIFFYGQSYMGSLDAILVAIGFRLFGEQVLVIRVLQSILYLATVFTSVLLAKKILKTNKAAFITGLLVSLPPVNVTLYTTVSLGGYGEMLLIGNLLLLGGLPIVEKIQNKTFEINYLFYAGIFLWTLGAGFAFWVTGLSLVYTIPIIGTFIWSALNNEHKTEIWKSAIFGLLGGLIGSLPWWFEALIYRNFSIVSELVGGAIANANQGIWLLQPLSRLLNLFIFGGSVIMGLRPPWNVKWLVLPVLPIILVFWLVVFLYSLRILNDKNKLSGLSIIAAIGLVLSIGFVLTPYGDDPSGRYFLPLVLPMGILGAKALSDLLEKRPILQTSVLLLILLFNIGGTVQAEKSSPTGITTQFDKVSQIDHDTMSDLIQFLKAENISRGYTNYWVSYPLAFLSQEDMIFLPRLPYHADFRYTSRDDRYSPYTSLVEGSDQVAYITTKHPELDNYLRDQFTLMDLSWKEKIVGDYHVFYHLSNPVNVYDIGLGQTTSP